MTQRAKGLVQIIKEAQQDGVWKLRLNSNRLTSLPPEIGLLKNLKSLDLSNNYISELPPEIGLLADLRSLKLGSNKLRTLPKQIGELASLETLALDNNQLVSLPSDIGQLRSLRTLYLGSNRLIEIPSHFGHLSQLEILSLDNNQFKSFPEAVTSLVNLVELMLDDNKIKSLPERIKHFKKLMRLSIANNKITVLLPEIGHLWNLTTLQLRDNQLISIPSTIGKLINLKILDLNNNNIQLLPKEVGQLANLTSLYLKGNQLSVIPPEVGRLAHLRELVVGKNLLTSPPPEIAEQGTEAILAYLQEQFQGGTRQWVSKLLLVGEGGVGKTSLLRSLRGDPFNTEESTTHGIEIGSLELIHPTESIVTMHLNTWDFGGQEIYHATHQFFLTNRSLFILVWNARLGFEQGRLYYWLDTIKARAPESPVLLVATFTDERDANIPLADLRRKYPQIVGNCETSNRTGEGIEDLWHTIAGVAANLPLMGENWPASWLNAAIAIRLKSKQENHIAPNQLFTIMNSHNVTGNRSKVLAQWLHELGDILYFQDDEELNDTVILNPEWVTQSISKVLESEEVIDNLGLFTRAQMNHLWGEVEPAMRDHFLRLMEKFDLSYRTLENKDISLVVERLNLDPPDYEPTWNAKKENGFCNQISMKFEMDTTMPAGIPTWFIARSHRFTTRTHWRYGALFADGSDYKNLGLIQAFPHDRYLTLTVRGSTPHNFFALLLDGLEVTLKRFPGMKIDRKIPCPGHRNESCTQEFDLIHLQKAIERKPPILEIQCPVSFEYVPIPSLLVGLPWNMTNEIIAEQYKKILSQMERLTDGMDELRELTQREFTKIFHREQAKIEAYCPNVFALRPGVSTGWIRSIAAQKMTLKLYCQAPGEWHPTELGGEYSVDQPAEWLRTVAPYIKRMVSVLKYAAPVLGPWVGVLSADQYEKRFKNDIKLMEELIKKLPELKDIDLGAFDDPRLSANLQGSYLERVEGAALRALRRLLEEKDPQQQWGGLKRRLTPEGHYLWLCHHHWAEYTK